MDSEKVQSMQAFTECSRGEAEAFIERYGDVEAAVNAYFDHSGILPPQTQAQAALTWNEEHFHTDKATEYGPQNKPGASFSIQSADTLNPSVLDPHAPSRPPSRVSNYVSNTPNDPMTMSHYSMGQETGVTNTGTHFGPAREGEYYDNHSWAMVVQPKGLYNSPDPEDRRRASGVPAFMRSPSSGHYLQALITILHAVPMAKEALLTRNKVLNDYGHSSDWWDGTVIRVAKVVYIDGPQEDTEWEDVIHEAQREMAFLEQTERAYGNVNPLLQLNGMFNGQSSEQGDFLQTWHGAIIRAVPNYELAEVFRTIAYNDPLALEPGDQEKTTIFEVVVHVSPKGQQLGPSLYEHLDEMLWTTDLEDEEMKSIYMEPGEILVFQVQSTDISEPGLGVEIPGVLYSDRYLKETMDVTKQMRRGRKKIFETMRQAGEKQRKLKEVLNTKTSRPIDAGELLAFATTYFEENQDKTGNLQRQSQSEMLVDVTDGQDRFNYGEVASELKAVAGRISELIQSLDEVKSRAEKQLHEISNLFKQPSDDPALNPTHRYTLRGVSTHESTIYVRANPNTTEDLIDTNSEDWIWWKLVFDPSATPAITHEQVSESDVLLAAKHEHRSVLLVYASDKAVSYPSQPLPPPLRNFVRADNLNFERELQEHLSSAASNHAEVDEGEFFERGNFANDTDVDYDEGVGAMIESDPPPYDAAVVSPPPAPEGDASVPQPEKNGLQVGEVQEHGIRW